MWHRITRRALQTLAGLGLAASLSACNMVVTPEPMFLEADQATPALREGLWVNPEKDCQFDIKTPATKWPECAHWIVVKDAAMTGVNKKEKFTIPFVLAVGEPRVMQIRIEDDQKKIVDGKIAAIYVYMGLRAVKTDKQGRITAYSGWMVQCGPPPPPDALKPDGNKRWGSLTPFPGIKMDEDLSGCVPEDKAALIKAAGLSEQYDQDADQNANSRWVRDGSK